MPGTHPKEQEQPSQPVPQGFAGATPRGLDVGGKIQPQDMYVAIHDRGLQPTYFGDEEKDPMKPPVGCPCDKETWKISYEDAVETTKKANPEWTPHKVRVETAVWWFRPKFRSDKASIKRETSGKRKYDSDMTFAMTNDGTLVYTSGGYEGWAIEDFSLRQKRLTPDQYSLRDHQTSLAIQEAFKSGAKTIVTSYYREGADNRDILVMEYDHEMKTGKITMINTEDVGTYHDFSTLQNIAQQEFPAFHEARPSDGIFLLTDKEIPKESMQRVILRVETENLQPIEKRVISESNLSHTLIPTDKSPLIREPIGLVAARAEETKKQHFIDIRTAFQAMTDFAQPHGTHTDENIKDEILRKLFTTFQQERVLELLIIEGLDQNIDGIKEEEIVELWKRKAQQVLEITPEQSQELLETVEETWETMVGAKEVISFAVDPETQGVAIPAAILALDILAHPEMILDEAIQEIRDENQVVPLTEKEWEAVVVFLMSDDEEIPPFESTHETETGSNIEHIDMTVLTWVKELMQRIYEEPVEQAIETIEHEEEATFLQMGELWRILIMRAQEFPVSDDSSEVYLVRVQEDETPEIRKQVEQFSFALTLWTLLKFDGYYRSLQSLKTFIVGETKRVNIIEKLKQRVPEGLIQREPAQWILLAIIWYLAMIREQGTIRTMGNKQQKTRKKKIKRGVIFAYAPVPDPSTGGSVRGFAIDAHIVIE